MVGPKEIGHGQRASERVDFPPGVSAGVHAADDGSHAAADDEIRPNTQAVEHSENPDVGQTLGASPGEDQRRARGPAGLTLGRSHRKETDENERESKHARAT